jgi:hypothetical protein
MINLTSEQARSKMQEGVRYKTPEGKPFIPHRRPKPVEPAPSIPEVIQAPPPQISQEILSAMIGVLRSNEENISAIANTQQSIISAIVEINKPKPKKRFHCPIVRDRSGVMIAVNVEEK